MDELSEAMSASGGALSRISFLVIRCQIGKIIRLPDICRAINPLISCWAQFLVKK